MMKKKWLICLSAVVAYTSLMQSALPVYAQGDALQETTQKEASNAYQRIRDYWKAELVGDMRGLESDQDLQNCIRQLDEKAKHYLNTMLDPSSSEHLWNDDAYNNAETGAKVTESLDRLKLISIQIWEPSSSLYQNKEAIAKVKAAMRFILDKKYGPNTVKGSSNWWDWEIGAPKAMVDITILFYDTFDQTMINDVVKTIDRFVPKADYRLNSSLKETGANLCDKVAIVIKRAALDHNDERMAHAKNCMSPLFGYSNSGDGYYPDGSFIQHNNIPYNGSYGYVLLDELTNCIIMLSFSDYAIDREDIAFYENTLLNHYIPFLTYGGNMADSVRGRAVSRKAQQGDTMGMQTMGVLLQYADVAATPTTKQAIYEQLKGIVDSKFAQPQNEDFSLLKYADYMRVKSLANNSALAAMVRNTYSVYSYMDRIVAQKDGFTFTVAANSLRMCTEQGNSENLLGRYQGQGYTQIYNDDINQYNVDYNATVDQMRLAGVTTAHQQLGFLTAGQSRWSGGSTLDGVNGVSGFELTGNKKLTTLTGGFGSESDTGVTSGITAKKSYFVFGDKIVYLGSAINNLGTDANVDFVESIVENRKAFAGMKLSVDGSEVVNANGTTTLTNPKSAYLTGKTANTGIGYVFLENMELDVKRETRNATWNDVNKIAKFTDYTPLSNDFISMSVNHGSTPSNDTYAWIVMPNVSRNEVDAYRANPTLVILDNNATLQAVKDQESGQSAYNFFTGGSSTDGIISTNAAVSLVVKQTADGYELAVSDPTRSLDNAQITIKGFTNLNHVGIVSGDAEVVSTTSDGMSIRVNFISKDGAPRKVSIGTTFTTTSNNLALNQNVTVSSVVQNTATAQREGRFAVDGDMTSRWASNYERGKPAISKEEADTGWLIVDLGSKQSFNQVKISWEGSISNDYDIQVSDDKNDPNSWVTVASVKENTPAKTERKDNITFDEVSARYVKMQSKPNSRPLQASSGTPAGGLSIWEFEVYNSIDLARQVARAQELLKEYPDASAFATQAQFQTLNDNLKAQLQAAQAFMANGANYTNDELLAISADLAQACIEYDQAVLHVLALTIDDPNINDLDRGEKKQLTVTIQPTNAYNKKLEWASSDRSIVRVDENGVITGVSSGTATITATSLDSGVSDTITVSVKVKPKTITLDQTSITMTKGESAQLTAVVRPVEAANTPLIYTAKDTSVVSVDGNGKLSAVGVGETDIIVTNDVNPDVRATCHVIVKANLIASSENLSLTPNTVASASTTVSNSAVSPLGAIDGDFNTRWASVYKDIPLEEQEQAWWMMELPAPITFNHIDITWFSATVYGKEFQILVSDDGVDWKVAYHETDGKNIDMKYSFDFETVSGKFVKFQGIKRAATGGGYGMVEFEVYYHMNYDTIITAAKQMLTMYPSTSAEYTRLKQRIAEAEQLLIDKPNFEQDELAAVLTAVNDAMSAYDATIVHVDGIQGNAMAMDAEESAPLDYVITPANAMNQEVTITNSDPSVARVDDKGIVHALKRGTTTVRVTTLDGGFTTDITIMVTSNYAPIINASNITVKLGSDFDPLAYASASDVEDGDLILTEANVIANDVDTSKEGVYTVTYRVSDSDGNVSEKTIQVSVKRDAALEAAKKQLNQTLAIARQIKAADYTAESYQALWVVMQEAEALLKDDNADSESLKQMNETLLNEIKALQPLHQNGGSNGGSQNNTQGGIGEYGGANTGVSAEIIEANAPSLQQPLLGVSFSLGTLACVLAYLRKKMRENHQ